MAEQKEKDRNVGTRQPAQGDQQRDEREGQTGRGVGPVEPAEGRRDVSETGADEPGRDQSTTSNTSAANPLA